MGIANSWAEGITMGTCLAPDSVRCSFVTDAANHFTLKKRYADFIICKIFYSRFSNSRQQDGFLRLIIENKTTTVTTQLPRPNDITHCKGL